MSAISTRSYNYVDEQFKDRVTYEYNTIAYGKFPVGTTFDPQVVSDAYAARKSCRTHESSGACFTVRSVEKKADEKGWGKKKAKREFTVDAKPVARTFEEIDAVSVV